MNADGLRGVQGFMASWRFAVTAVSLLVFFAGLVGAILLVPEGEGAVASFAADFRMWCFGYDTETQSLNTAMVLTTFSELLVLAAMIVLVWLDPLRRLVRSGVRPALPYVAGSFVVVLAIAGGLGALATNTTTEPPAFPAQALRTQLEPPRFSLQDQDGEVVTLEQLRGKTVLMTAVYASCGLSCPTVLAQTKRVVGGLSDAQRENLAVIAVTLDPERDDGSTLKRLADAQRISSPLYRLLTGEPAVVNAALDAMQVARKRNEETGIIDHANVFSLTASRSVRCRSAGSARRSCCSPQSRARSPCCGEPWAAKLEKH
jgi:protein SCO1